MRSPKERSWESSGINFAAANSSHLAFQSQFPREPNIKKISAVLWEILRVISWEKSTVKGGGQVFHLVKFFDSAELVSRTGTSGARHNCYKWLLKLAEQGSKTMTKSEYREEAMRRFPGLSMRGFASAWTQAVGDNPDWTRPGRRRGTTH